MAVKFIIPFEVWPEGILQARFPANNNALRAEILAGLVISKTTTAQPASPADGDIYIIPAGATGAQWSLLDADDLAIFKGGSWYAFAPVPGVVVNFDGSQEQFAVGSPGGWDPVSGGGGGPFTAGKQAIPIMAGSMRPSLSGGCATLAAIASASNQPDIISLDFDATTEEYAQFAIPMPKKWNEGTITARFRWSHAATTTNFGVVWAIQAVAVSDDDTIAVNFGTAQTVTDTGGTTNDLYVSDETSAITVGGSPAAGDTVFFRVYRKSADGSDNMAIDARLHGIDIFVTTDADTDA